MAANPAPGQDPSSNAEHTETSDARDTLKAAAEGSGNTALHHAVLSRNISDAELLLNDGCDVNATNEQGYTPLHFSIMDGDPVIVKMLLDRGADMNQTRGGMSPLHMAIMRGRLSTNGGTTTELGSDSVSTYHVPESFTEYSVFQLLLDSTADLKVVCNDGNTRLFFKSGSNYRTTKKDVNTPLHLATKRAHLNIMELLLLKGADVNITNAKGHSPLHYAVAGSDTVAAVQLLLDFGANVKDTEALHFAVRNGDMPLVKLLLDNGADVNNKGLIHVRHIRNYFQTLLYAVPNNNTALTNFLLDVGPDIYCLRFDVRGNTPLHWAVCYGYLDILKLLLSNGADPNKENKKNCTPLHYAVFRGVAFVTSLLDFGANVNMVEKKGKTPLYLAATNCDESVVELLLKRGAELDTQNIYGYTALHIAALKGDTTILRLLLEFNANVNIVNEKGNTPLFIALVRGHLPSVELLLNNESELNITNKIGYSPLHAAMFGGNLYTVKMLLDLGANINAIEAGNGDTALHMAVKDGHLAIVELLLSKNADKEVTNYNGFTPLQFAARCGHVEIVELLVNNGANMNKICEKPSWQVQETVDCDKVGEIDEKVELTDDGVEIKPMEITFKTTPLLSAILSSNGYVVSKVIKMGADINAAYTSGDTPLHYAAYFANKEIIMLLLNAGAHLDSINRAGQTPLHYAVIGNYYVLRLIMSKNIIVDSILTNKLMATYHVVLARKVLHKCDPNREFCMWKFQPEFFKASSYYSVYFKSTIVNDFMINRYDLAEITDTDRENIISFLNSPCVTVLGQLIGKVVTYNEKTKKIQLIEDPGFRKDEIVLFTEQFNELNIELSVVTEAVIIKLLSLEIKLPIIFGNSDMFYSVNETKINETMDALTDKLVNLLKIFNEDGIVTLNDNIVGKEKILDEEVISIGSAVGNLLVLDTNTKTLKFEKNISQLPHNADLFLKKLKDHTNYHFIDPLERYQFIIDIKGFPKYSFDASEYDKRDARDFLNKLWFYTNQANGDKVESILKDEINKYYYNKINERFNIHGYDLQSRYLSSQARDYLQKWSLQTIESPYLSRLSDVFQRAKLSDIYNILRSAVNYLYIQNIHSVEIKFCQRVNQVENFVKLMQLFTQMSSSMFRLFDQDFDKAFDVTIPTDSYPSDCRQLVFRLEIGSKMEYVKLVMTSPAMREHYRYLAHTTAARFGGRVLIQTKSSHRELVIQLNSTVPQCGQDGILDVKWFSLISR